MGVHVHCSAGGLHPNAAEIWYDGTDQDCSSGSDYDQDGDGDDYIYFGGNDCNDSNPAVNSMNYDIPNDGIDQDCSGQDATDGGNGSGNTTDQDGDGFNSSSDCNDNNASIYPGAYDTPNDGIDQDCNGQDATTGGGSSVCSDSCGYANDNVCDDGGTGASFDDCDFGTDCSDCGVRNPCEETCTPWGTQAYSNNGVCEDGGPNSNYSTCDRGTDCLDCGSY